MAIKKRFVPKKSDPILDHKWRIENAKWHIAYFKKAKNAHKLKIWQGVLDILEKRSYREVLELASG